MGGDVIASQRIVPIYFTNYATMCTNYTNYATMCPNYTPQNKPKAQLPPPPQLPSLASHHSSPSLAPPLPRSPARFLFSPISQTPIAMLYNRVCRALTISTSATTPHRTRSGLTQSHSPHLNFSPSPSRAPFFSLQQHTASFVVLSCSAAPRLVFDLIVVGLMGRRVGDWFGVV